MFGLWSDMRKRELVTSFLNSLIGFFFFFFCNFKSWAGLQTLNGKMGMLHFPSKLGMIIL
jgi:hypothetical protein